MVTCCECEDRYAIVKLQYGNLWKDMCLVCVKVGKQSTGLEPVIFDQSIHMPSNETDSTDISTNSDLYYPFNELADIENKFKELNTLQNRALERDHQEEVKNIISMKAAMISTLQRIIETHT